MAKKKQAIFEIDSTNLDHAWYEQSQLMYDATLELAERRKDMEEAKVALELERSQSASAIREKPTDFGLDKLTEKGVEQTLPTIESVQKAQQVLIDAKYQLSIQEGLVNALEHRKRTLESLVTLHGQGYFSSPRADTEPTTQPKAIKPKKDKKKRKETTDGKE